MRALSKIEDFLNQFANALHLPANAGLGLLPKLRRGALHSGHFRGDADDIERIFQIMDDRPREPAQYGQSLALQHFAHVMAIKFAQPLTDLGQ